VTRDQMIAWLTIEGWSSHKCKYYGDVTSWEGPGIRCDTGYYFCPVVSGERMAKVAGGGDRSPSMDPSDFMPLDHLHDEDLKLLYEAVANQVS